MKVRKAVIPAAGFGTRFLPFSKAVPKEMLPVVDKPVIQYVVEEAVASGIEDILIITGRGKRAIEDHFDRSIELESYLDSGSQVEIKEQIRKLSGLASIHFIRQQEPLGLGHAVLQAKRHIGDEPFAVLLADEIFIGKRPCLAELVDIHQLHTNSSVIAVRKVNHQSLSNYGVINPRSVSCGLHQALALIEKPLPEQAPSNLAIVGRYILESRIFDILPSVQPGRNGEIQLTDALNALAGSHMVFGLEIESQRFDVGNKLGYIQATLEFALARNDLRTDVEQTLTAFANRVSRPTQSST